MKNPLPTEILHPVILPVGPEYQALKAPERVKYLSRRAREALILSEKSWGSVLGPIERLLKNGAELPKNEENAPIPVEGCYWSLSHKPEYVAAVVSLRPAGIDIEKIRPFSERLWEKIADEKEKGLMDPGLLQSFFRFWTAKEAVLKAGGAGLTELSQCRMVAVTDEFHVLLKYRNRLWQVEHCYLDGHIASIVKDDLPVEWNPTEIQRKGILCTGQD
jgi:4'-phosphopantetheinyl transferase